MMDDIFAGAIRVLKQEGGRHFTTIRVAEAAGISVGSLYQYFPNKDSILFEIQRREWVTTSSHLLGILADTQISPLDRLKRMIAQFFESELEEADLREAIAETGLLMEDTEDFRKIDNKVLSGMIYFLKELLPHVPPKKSQFLAKFLLLTIRSLAEELTTQVRSPSDIKRWTDTCTQMVMAFLRESASGRVT